MEARSCSLLENTQGTENFLFVCYSSLYKLFYLIQLYYLLTFFITIINSFFKYWDIFYGVSNIFVKPWSHCFISHRKASSVGSFYLRDAVFYFTFQGSWWFFLFHSYLVFDNLILPKGYFVHLLSEYFFRASFHLQHPCYSLKYIYNI